MGTDRSSSGLMSGRSKILTDIAAEIDAVNTRSTPVERLWSASWVGSSRNDLKSAPGEMAGLDDLPTVSNFEALIFRRDIQLEDSSEECWLADCLGQPARRIRERADRRPGACAGAASPVDC